MDYSALLLLHLRASKITSLVPEYKFHPTRKWRIDFADPGCKLAIEIDGAVHRIKSRFIADMEKHQALFFGGWRLLRVSTHQVRSGQALRYIETIYANWEDFKAGGISVSFDRTTGSGRRARRTSAVSARG